MRIIVCAKSWIFLPVVFMAAIVPARAASPLVSRLVALDNDTRAAAQQEASTLSLEDQKPVVASLVRILEGHDADRSEHAAESLGQMGPAAYSAMPALREGLGAEFPYVRSRCSEALLKMGPAAVPEFIKALKSENMDVRTIASAALEKLGPAAKPAARALVASLDDPEQVVRAAAVRALTQIGPDAVPVLEEALGNPHFHNRIEAVRTLSNIEPTPPDLADHLVAILGEGDTQLRVAVIRTLAHKGEASVPALRKALSSENAFTSSGAAEAIADIGPNAAPAVPELIAALKSPNSRVRRSAVRALGNIGFGAGAAVPALQEATKDPDKEVAVRAAEALTTITVYTNEGKRVTMDKAQDLAREAVRQKDQMILAKAGIAPAAAAVSRPSAASPPRPRVAAIARKPVQKVESSPGQVSISAVQWVKRCASDDSKARLAAAQAFAQSGVTAVPTARKALDDEDWRLRQCACETLEQLGPLANPAQEGLNQALRDSSVEVRKSAVQALRAMNSIAATRSIEWATNDSDASIRLASLTALESLGPGTALSVPRMAARLKDPDAEVQSAAVRVLEKIGTPEARGALDSYHGSETFLRVSTLVDGVRQSTRPLNTSEMAAMVQIGAPVVLPVSRLLLETNLRARLAAAQVLNLMGSAAAPATPMLIEALQDPDDSVRRESAQALEKIGSPQTKNPLRLYYMKEKGRYYLKKMHVGGS